MDSEFEGSLASLIFFVHFTLKVTSDMVMCIVGMSLSHLLLSWMGSSP